MATHKTIEACNPHSDDWITYQEWLQPYFIASGVADAICGALPTTFCLVW